MSGSDLLSIELKDHANGVEPGASVSGTASWQVERAKSVQVRLFWYTSGMGTRDVQIIDSKAVDQPPAVGETSFSFQLPDEPYTFSGKLISLIWAVELIVEPGDRSTRTEFVMAPGGIEILLGTVKDMV